MLAIIGLSVLFFYKNDNSENFEQEFRDIVKSREGLQDGPIYKNIKYGFVFTVPDGWKIDHARSALGNAALISASAPDYNEVSKKIYGEDETINTPKEQHLAFEELKKRIPFWKEAEGDLVVLVSTKDNSALLGGPGDKQIDVIVTRQSEQKNPETYIPDEKMLKENEYEILSIDGKKSIIYRRDKFRGAHIANLPIKTEALTYKGEQANTIVILNLDGSISKEEFITFLKTFKVNI